MSPPRTVLLLLGLALAWLAPAASWAQSDYEMKRPEYWRARFAQARGEVAAAREDEAKKLERYKEYEKETKKEEWVDARERTFALTVEKAKKRRLRAEGQLYELKRAADELGIPPEWRGDVGGPAVIAPTVQKGKKK